MAKFCTNCGASLADTAKFCNGCGTKQDDAPLVQQQQPVQQPAPPVQQPVRQPTPPVQQAPQQPQPQYRQPQQPQPTVQQPPIQQYPQPPMQQQYQQPAQQAPQAKPKKKRRIPLVVKIIGIAVLVIVVGVIIAVTVLNSAGKADYVKFGKDQIPSVKLALGEERNLTSASTSAAVGGGQTKVFVYQVSGTEQNTDMFNYLTYLREKDGFLLLTGFDFNGPEGACLVGRNSVEDGYEIQLQIEYDRSGYTITILKQKGGITPNAPGSGNQTPGQSVSPGGGTVSSQTPAPSSSPTPEPSSSPTPEPSSSPTSDTGSLTKDIFDIVNSGTYHMKINILMSSEYSSEDGFVVEVFVKNGMTAVLVDFAGMDTQLIYKDGIIYTVIYDFEVVLTEEADPDDDIGYNITYDNMVYIGEGSGDFRGKTYRYDEYRSEYGSQIFYFVDNGALKGKRIIMDGESSDMEILALDRNVPDSVFDIPEDFVVMEG